jgi:nascent polypeptide-associated complex subunit beta
MLSNTLAALSFLPFALAHFELKYPATRGFSEDSEGSFPCGGYNDVSSQRADFPMSGGPIQLNMGHTQTNVAVYMAVGEKPGDGFSVVLRPQLQVTGLGDFCIGDIQIPSNLNISDGTPATIQVITNAHGEGGLYQVSIISSSLAWRAMHCV